VTEQQFFDGRNSIEGNVRLVPTKPDGILQSLARAGVIDVF
jgi:hypothetical protein